MRPPYTGQGTKLPSDMGSGVWVIQNLVHLTFAGEAVVASPPAWDFDPAELRSPPATNVSVGFSARRLSDALGVPFDELVEANRRGLLRVTMARVAGEGGDDVRFRFGYGDRRFEVVCEVAPRDAGGAQPPP